jgi:hypothetical protein
MQAFVVYADTDSSGLQVHAFVRVLVRGVAVYCERRGVRLAATTLAAGHVRRALCYCRLKQPIDMANQLRAWSQSWRTATGYTGNCRMFVDAFVARFAVHGRRGFCKVNIVVHVPLVSRKMYRPSDPEPRWLPLDME